MCDVVRTNFDEVVAKTEVHGQKAVDGVVHADGQIKQVRENVFVAKRFSQDKTFL